jgi:acyl-CoA synthetase (AMP-forming)/AMP-acid ligase II
VRHPILYMSVLPSQYMGGRWTLHLPTAMSKCLSQSCTPGQTVWRKRCWQPAEAHHTAMHQWPSVWTARTGLTTPPLHLSILPLRPSALSRPRPRLSLAMPWSVVALLAVMKAGRPYLPLDPAYPASRLTYMLEHSRTSIVLTVERVIDSRFLTQRRVLSTTGPCSAKILLPVFPITGAEACGEGA